MRTTLIKGALKRACDAPGCNHEWRQCPVHDVRRESVQASPTCRGCGYHVCSCYRPATDADRRGPFLDLEMLNDRGPDPRRGASFDVRLRDEIDAIDLRLTRDQLNKWACLMGVKQLPDEDDEALRRRIRERCRPSHDLSSTSGDDRRLGIWALRSRLMREHGFSEKMARLVSDHHTKPMLSMLMKAENVSAEISRENPFVVFVKGAIPPGGKFNEFFYRLDTEGDAFALSRGNADGALSPATLSEYLVEDHGISRLAARLIESHPETFPPKSLTRAHEVRVIVPAGAHYTLRVIVDGQPMGDVSWE